MSYQHNSEDDYVTEEVETDNQTAEMTGHIPYRHLSVRLTGDEVVNDGSDAVVVTIEVVDGLEVARGASPSDANVLDYSGDVTVAIDGNEITKTLTDGSVEFNLTTEKPAGSGITVSAESLADHPSESDSVDIEVVKP